MAEMKSDRVKLVSVTPRRRLSEKVPTYHVVAVDGGFRAYVEGPFTDDWIDLKPGTVRSALDTIGLHLEAHIQTLGAIGFDVMSPPT